MCRSERLSRTLLKNLGFKADSLLLICGCYYSFPNTVIGLLTSLIGLMFQISKISTQVWRLLREKMQSIIDQFGQLQDWVSTHSNWISLPTSIISVHFFQKKAGLSRLLLSRLGALAPLVSSTSSLRGHHRLHQKNTSLEFSPSIVPWSSNLSAALLSNSILRLELLGLWSFKQKWHWCQYWERERQQLPWTEIEIRTSAPSLPATGLLLSLNTLNTTCTCNQPTAQLFYSFLFSQL